jgi:hypothetical protein
MTSEVRVCRRCGCIVAVLGGSPFAAQSARGERRKRSARPESVSDGFRWYVCAPDAGAVLAGDAATSGVGEAGRDTETDDSVDAVGVSAGEMYGGGPSSTSPSASPIAKCGSSFALAAVLAPTPDRHARHGVYVARRGRAARQRAQIGRAQHAVVCGGGPRGGSEDAHARHSGSGVCLGAVRFMVGRGR